MTVQKAHFTRLAMALLLSACNLPREASKPTPTLSPEPATPAASATAPSTGPEDPPIESILILEPGPGSRLTSPLRVAGIADPTFEQTLAVRLVLDDGTELALGSVTIEAELGQRGPFAGELDFTISEERNALLQVYDQSARDGGITHLASMGVTLAPDGPINLVPSAPRPESLHIIQPALGDRISGGIVRVRGIGLASFEGTLVIEIYDEDGSLVGSEPLIVDAPDMGMPGTFDLEVAYAIAAEGVGRVVVMDPLPVFDGIGHIASVEVTLAP